MKNVHLYPPYGNPLIYKNISNIQWNLTKIRFYNEDGDKIVSNLPFVIFESKNDTTTLPTSSPAHQ
jgi:hypothetical protein